MKPITEIAHKLGILKKELEPYGKYVAKVSLNLLKRLEKRPYGKLIAVTGMTPTILGEGKTVTAFGLGEALARIGKKVCNTTRQSSKGPIFGIKGGASGGGYAQILPSEKINLHFTGDAYAVEAANNLLAAIIDSHIFHGNKLNIDPAKITWRRCLDISDVALREVSVGINKSKIQGYPRKTGFDITAASETMAILALAKNLPDLRKKLGKALVGFTYTGKLVTAKELGIAGAMTALLKDALEPNLVQTTENTPVLVHAGPFANVSHGNNSVIADMMALKLADYTVTESGFGADCGFEKLVNVKCRQSGLKVDAAVLVVSARALKIHGVANLAKQIENVHIHGVPVIVAINRFKNDTEDGMKLIRRQAIEAGAEEAAVSQVWENGGKGGVALAKAVLKMLERPSRMKFLYSNKASIKEKIETVAKNIYGAGKIEYSPLAEENIALYNKLGYASLPINIAKTHLSLTEDPKVKGAPRAFKVNVTDVRLAAGAGFLYPILGRTRTMPALPSAPAALRIDVDAKGRTKGLF